MLIGVVFDPWMVLFTVYGGNEEKGEKEREIEDEYLRAPNLESSCAICKLSPVSIESHDCRSFFPR